MTVQAVDRALAGIAPAGWAPYAAIGTLLLVELVAILALNGGMLVYTLDDPYIHLALAENIARGHYGINLGEASAPSSSILWPFLLVPFAGTAFHDEWPLVLNIAATFGSVGVLNAIVRRAIPSSAVPISWLSPLIVVAVAIAFNLVGLAFTGMEHSLQVLLALAVVLGLLVEAEARRVPWFLIVAIIVGPLVRYENFALSLGAIVYLGLRGRPVSALTLGALALAPLAAFSLFLHGLGLELLPSSVLVKTDVKPTDPTLWDALKAVRRSLRRSYTSHSGQVLFALAALFAWCAWRRKSGGKIRALAVAGAVIVLGHIGGGRYGWFGRYEVYVLVSAAMLLLYLWSVRLSNWLRSQSTISAGASMLLVISLFGLLTFQPTLWTPLAANNIYEQQFQMHRFVVEYGNGAIVAVNDLGWVSYRNDGYVLDLWGLGSVEAGARRVANERGWMEDIVTRHGAQLAMIYDAWFDGQIPPHWERLGTLYLGRPRVTPASGEVAFYATDPAAAPEFRARLAAFARTLPEGVVFATDSPGG